MRGIIAISCFSLVLLFSIGCNGDSGDIGGSGMLEATEALVSCETSGRVMDLRFDEGSAVKRGDTLAVIDPSRLHLERKAAASNLTVIKEQLTSADVKFMKAVAAEEYASKERDRITKLVASGTATQQQLDKLEQEALQTQLARMAVDAERATLRAQHEKVSAEIDRIDRAIADCYPAAPISGIVTAKHLDLGELAAPGKPLTKISRLDSLWVKVYLPAQQFASVKIGDRATVDTESGNETIDGVVIWTADEAEFTPKNVQTEKSRADLVYGVKVLMANNDGRLKIGMPVYVTIGEAETSDTPDTP